MNLDSRYRITEQELAELRKVVDAEHERGGTMGLSIEEQETHVSFNRSADKAIVYTSDTTTMTKLDKLVSAAETEWKLESVSRLHGGEIVGKTYSCPKSFISFRTKKVSRELSEDQRRELSERMKRNRVVESPQNR